MIVPVLRLDDYIYVVKVYVYFHFWNACLVSIDLFLYSKLLCKQETLTPPWYLVLPFLEGVNWLYESAKSQ